MSLKLRDRLPRVSVALLLACFLVHAQTAQDPPCYNNRPAPAHYRTETGPDGSALRSAGVSIMQGYSGDCVGVTGGRS